MASDSKAKRLTHQFLLNWLRAELRSVQRSNTEVDGVIRSPYALTDIKAISDLSAIVREHRAATKAAKTRKRR